MGSSPYPRMGSSCACSTAPSREVCARPQPILASPKKGSSLPHQLPTSLAGPHSWKFGCFSLRFGEMTNFDMSIRAAALQTPWKRRGIRDTLGCEMDGAG